MKNYIITYDIENGDSEKYKQLNETILKHFDCADSKNITDSLHPGGSLSEVEILVSLYFFCMNIDPRNPEYRPRDRFILSKGHAAPGLYAVLAKRGYFDREELLTLRNLKSRIQGHPDMKKTPGVDFSSGSLRHGSRGQARGFEKQNLCAVGRWRAERGSGMGSCDGRGQTEA